METIKPSDHQTIVHRDQERENTVQNGGRRWTQRGGSISKRKESRYKVEGFPYTLIFFSELTVFFQSGQSFFFSLTPPHPPAQDLS